MSEELKVNFNFKPFTWQANFLADFKGKQNGLILASRQHGKSELAIACLFAAAFSAKSGETLGYFGPTIKNCRGQIWPRLKRFLPPKLLRLCTVRESELTIVLPNGVRIVCFGCDSPDSIRGYTISYCLLDEADSISSEALNDCIIPTTSAIAKPVMLYIGTVKGEHYLLWQMHLKYKDDPNWATIVVNAETAGVMPGERLAEYKAKLPKATYMREYLCDPYVPVSNAVFVDELMKLEEEKRVQNFGIRHSAPLHFAFDLGVRDFMVVWTFQLLGNDVLIGSYHQWQGVGLEDVIAELKDIYEDFSIGQVLLPHDIAQRELMSGQSRYDTFLDYNFGEPVVLKRENIADTLNATRKNFKFVHFNKDWCEDGLAHLKSLQYAVSTGGEVLDKFIHNKHSHAGDAFRYIFQWIEYEFPSYNPARGLGRQEVVQNYTAPQVVRQGA